MRPLVDNFTIRQLNTSASKIRLKQELVPNVFNSEPIWGFFLFCTFYVSPLIHISKSLHICFREFMQVVNRGQILSVTGGETEEAGMLS